MIKPFHQWKDEIVKQDSKEHNVLLYFRWPKHVFYQKYGHYVEQMRKKEKCSQKEEKSIMTTAMVTESH